MSPRFDLARQVVDLALTLPEWPLNFAVVYGFEVFQLIIGLDRDVDQDPHDLVARLSGVAPGEVTVRVLPRSDWERGARDLDKLLLDAFEQGTVLHDLGGWRALLTHFQALADRGMIVRTRYGWRRQGDRPRDPDAEMLARFYQALRRRPGEPP